MIEINVGLLERKMVMFIGKGKIVLNIVSIIIFCNFFVGI